MVPFSSSWIYQCTRYSDGKCKATIAGSLLDMCGITGAHCTSPEARVEPGLLEAMVATLHHRGPNDVGYYHSRGISMGMRRLSIIDVAGGHQPIENEDGTVHLVCNGEIYNYQKVRAELKKHGHRFSTKSDAEVLVHAYEQWGLTFIERIDGMFGFALWDERNETFLLGRDRLGIKPLYLARVGEWLIFGSEIKALLQWPGLSASVNSDALVSHLQRRFALGRECIFHGIERLEPGSLLVRRGRHEETRHYWDVEVRLSEITGSPEKSHEHYAEQIRTTLSDCIASHLMSEVPLGAFLSGGLDSSSLVSLMSSLSESRVKTYNIDFLGIGAQSEASYAADVAKTYSTDHRVMVCDPPSEELLRKIVRHLEEPIADPAVVPTYLMSELAAAEVTVVMTGEGSDESNGGYGKYQMSADGGGSLARLLNVMPVRLRRGMMSAMALSRFGVARKAERRLAWSLARKMDFALADTELSWKVEALGVLDPILLEDGNEFSDGFSADPQAHFLSDFKGWLPNDLLLKVDRMSMAHSLEARVPYLDHNFVELALSIPWQLKLSGGQTKRVFRDAMRPVLPDRIRNREQHGFTTPLQGWLAGPLAPLVGDLLSEANVRSRGYFQPSSVGRIRKRAQAGDGSVTNLTWALIIMELWHQEFIDRPKLPLNSG